ncbi:MAG: hypothetical protein EA001_00145, partial [Oscillatoriales cyanobacterium]
AVNGYRTGISSMTLSANSGSIFSFLRLRRLRQSLRSSDRPGQQRFSWPRLSTQWVASLGTFLGTLVAAPGMMAGGAIAAPPDAANHWSRHCLTALMERQWLPLDASGKFRPDEPITPAELTALLTRAVPEGRPIAQTDKDNEPIQRDRAIAITLQRLGWQDSSGDPRAGNLLRQTFEDGDRVDFPIRSVVAAAVRAGAVVNYPNPRRLEPDRPATRAEAAALVCQALSDRLETPATDSFTPFVARPPETRGAWLTNIDSEVLFDRAKLRQALENLKAANFNTVYITVWNNGYTLHPSAVAERASGNRIDPHPGLQGRDVLAEAIAEGKRLGLAIVPWLEFGLMAPANSDLARRNPGWIAERRDGSSRFQYGRDTRVWLNPSHPGVQQLMTDLVDELVSRYPIDGIQFDDHFAYPVDLGHDPTTQALYALARSGQTPPETSNDPDWMRWRSNQLTQLMGQIHRTVKAKRPGAIVSLSPNPQPFAYATSLQSWSDWVGRGWVDELIVQIYRDDINGFEAELLDRDLQIASYKIPVSVGILTGLKVKPMPIDRVAEQVQLVRQKQLAGVSFFFYESLWNLTPENQQRRQQTIRRLFFNPAFRSIAR